MTKCGVEITEAKVRRERLGHITLASPVVHTWFLRNSSSPLATLLDIKTKDLEEIVYLASYIVISADKDTGFSKKTNFKRKVNILLKVNNILQNLKP